MKKRKPSWVHISPEGICVARCDNSHGYKSVRINGISLSLLKVEQLAKWFAAAAAWLKNRGEK